MLDPSRCLEVPKDFDDEDAETQVHPMARKLFHATTAAGVFMKVHDWVAENDVRLADLSWDYLYDEDEPYWLSVYFVFELDDEED